MTTEKETTQQKQIHPPIDEDINGHKLIIMADHPEGKRRVAVYRRRTGELFARYERLGLQRLKDKTRLVWRPELIPGEHFEWMAKAMVMIIAELYPPEDEEEIEQK